MQGSVASFPTSSKLSSLELLVSTSPILRLTLVAAFAAAASDDAPMRYRGLAKRRVQLVEGEDDVLGVGKELVQRRTLVVVQARRSGAPEIRWTPGIGRAF
eukprot:scaffold116021_cov32-Tisochrysis_lutea.AAC.2